MVPLSLATKQYIQRTDPVLVLVPGIHTCNLGKGGIPVRHVDQLITGRTRFDFSRPECDARYPDTAFEIVTFTTTEKYFTHTRRAVMGHRAVVRHKNDQGIFGDAQLFQPFHQLANKGVQIRKPFLKEPTR